MTPKFANLLEAIKHYQAHGYTLTSSDALYARLELEASIPHLVIFKVKPGHDHPVMTEFEGGAGNVWVPVQS
jgi:hypothetical protein